VALYLRVSTSDQTCENQRRILQETADRQGWQVCGVYQDDGISGAKGRDKRPAYDELLKAVTRKEVDMVAAYSVDRLGRSLIDLLSFMQELHAKGCGLYLHTQGIDTSTPAGQAMFSMLGVFAQFERELIRERVRAGMARARSEGKVFGRPQVGPAVEVHIRELRAAGVGIRKTAKLAGCGVSAVQRVDREAGEVGHG
jgi:DNA invertase Pin-like site-specific DNA recombinase